MKNDYNSSNNIFHSSNAPVPKDHRDIDENVHKCMKKPNVAIGKGEAENNTSQKLHYRTISMTNDPTSRRADPSNPNRVMTIGFGFGAEKGDIE